MKNKAIVFGIGNRYRVHQSILSEKYEIIAFADSYVRELDGKKVIPISEAAGLGFDKIIITPMCWPEMLKECMKNGIEKEKIIILDLMHELWERTVCGVKAFGQYFEDLIILGIFGQIKITNPSYLDIGCNHPYRISNTALMYLNGAKGVNVDANKVSIDAFNLVRTNNTLNINCGVTPNCGLHSFYMQSDDSGLNTFAHEEIEYAKKKFNTEFNRVEKVECITLGNIIDVYCEGKFPDFFDCDIEGLDYDVMKSYNMSSNGPKVVCVEVRPDKTEQFDSLLYSYGYFLFCRIGGNTIYVRNEFKKILMLYNKALS